MGQLWVDGFRNILGKRVAGLVVTQCGVSPERQLFLIFDDNTHYELFGSDVRGCKGVDPGGFDEVRTHVHSRPGVEILLECTLE